MRYEVVRNLTLTAVLVCGAWAHVLGSQERVKVSMVVGKVEIRTPNSPRWRPARMGMPVKMGWDVRTYVESRAELMFATGSTIRVGENSVVTLSKAMRKQQTTQSKLKVGTGRVWANVKKLTGNRSSFEFETPTAVAAIRGTRLGLKVGQRGDSIEVYEGLVMVRRRDGSREVAVGTRNRAVVAAASEEIEVEEFADTDSTGTPVDPFVADSAAGDSTVQDSSAGGDSSSVVDTSSQGAVFDSTADLALRVVAPRQGAIVTETPVLIKGVAAPGAAVTVGEKEVKVSAEGNFSSLVDIKVASNVIPVLASLGENNEKIDVEVEYRPALSVSLANVVDNMEVSAEALTVDVDITPGADYSINGKEGETEITLQPGANVITVKAWDQWGTTVEKHYTVHRLKMDNFELNLAAPQKDAVLRDPMIPVSGSTLPGAKVSVNGTGVPVNSGGFFSTQIPIPDEPREYTVEVVAVLGEKELTEQRVVEYKPESEPLSLVITSPVDGQAVTSRTFRVSGKTAAGAAVTINGRRVMVSPRGIISTEMQVMERDIGEYTLDIVAFDEHDELAQTLVLEIDGSSPMINTSVPTLIVAGHGRQATRDGRLVVQVQDRTPDDEITLVAESNGTSDEYVLEPGGRETITLDEGKNEYSFRAYDKAGNMSNVVNGTIHYLPGPLTIEILEPSDNPWVIDDLPPMPRGARVPTLTVEVEVEDNIGDVPKTIRYCRISGGGQQYLLRDNGDYTFSGEVPLHRGRNVMTVQVEDLAGNVEMEELTVEIE